MTPEKLADAIKAAKKEILYCKEELKGEMSHAVGYGGMTYGQLDTIIIRIIELENENGETHARIWQLQERLKEEYPTEYAHIEMGSN